MNKQEAIEKIKNIDTLSINDMITNQKIDMVIKNQVLGIISQINEPQKPVVPRFVAEWLKKYRWAHTLLKFLNDAEKGQITTSAVNDWILDNQYDFIKAWIDGYEVEKEKLYMVEIPNPNLNAHVVLQKTEKGIVLISVTNARWRGWESSKLTESEIRKDFDFLWQFAKGVEE